MAFFKDTKTSPTNTSFGYNASATGGTGALALGVVSVASGLGSIAIGYNTQATNTTNLGIGFSVASSGVRSTAIGIITTATQQEALAIGYSTDATGSYSVALGPRVDASGSNSIGIGRTTRALGADSIAIGNQAGGGSGSNVIAIGSESGNNSANGEFNTTIGFSSGADITGAASVAEVVDITTVAGSSITENQYFWIYAADASHYFWYNKGTGTDPNPVFPIVVYTDATPSRVTIGHEVSILNADTDAQVASKTQAVIDAIAAFSASVLTNVITVTHTVTGNFRDAENGNMSTPFTFNTTTQGSRSGSFNFITGTNSGAGVTTAYNSIIIGEGATISNTARDSVVIGTYSESRMPFSVVIGTSSRVDTVPYFGGVAIGHNAICKANGGVYVGTNVGSSSAASPSYGSVVIGYSCATKITNSLDGDVIIGPYAGYDLTGNGTRNVLVGKNAGIRITDGFDNVALGRNTFAGVIGKTCGVNVGIGVSTFGSLVSGDYNVAIGSDTDVSVSYTSYAIIIGQNTVANTDAIAIGRTSRAISERSIAIGKNSGSATAVGPDNIMVGYNSGNAITGAASVAEVVEITTVAGSSITENQYFWIYAADATHYFWYNKGTGTDPNPVFTLGTYTDATPSRVTVGHEVSILNADTDAQVASKTQAVIDAIAAFSASVLTNVITVTHAVTGNFRDAENGNMSTPFTFNTTTQGSRSGSFNFIAGTNSGAGVTTGYNSIVIGEGATVSNTARDSVVIGTYSESNMPFSVAIGTSSRVYTTTYFGGVAIGHNAICKANGGVYVGTNVGSSSAVNVGYGAVVIGYQCAVEVTNSLDGDVIIGAYAGTRLTGNGTGGNVLLGTSAGSRITDGGRNIAIGRNAMVGGLSGSTGDENIGMGTSSLGALTTGDNNTSLGNFALGNLTTGSYNVAIGANTSRSVTNINYTVNIGASTFANRNQITGNDSIVIGTNTDVLAVGAIAIGKSSSVTAGNYAITIGHTSVTNGTAAIAIGRTTNATAADAIAIGTGADATQTASIALGLNTQATSTNSIAIGGGSTTTTSANALTTDAIAIGRNALVDDSNTVANYLAPNNIAIGRNSTAIGSSSITIGYNSGHTLGAAAPYNASDDGNNIVLGVGSFNISTTGETGLFQNVIVGNNIVTSSNGNISYNVIIGNDAITTGTSCQQSVIIGCKANQAASPYNSVTIGYLASCNSNSRNVAIGRSANANTNAIALAAYATASGNSSIALGNNAVSSSTTSIAIGFNSSATTGTSNIAIGDSSSATGGSNCIAIGDTVANATANSIQFPTGLTAGSGTTAVWSTTTGGTLRPLSSTNRVKTNITDLESATSEKIYELRPVTFDMKYEPESPNQFGLIAEEVAAIIPNLAGYGQWVNPETNEQEEEITPVTVKYMELSVLLLAEMKKLRTTVNELLQRVDVLEKP